MKKVLFIFLVLFTIASCKDDTVKAVQENNTVEEETEQDTVPTVSGKFIFTEKHQTSTNCPKSLKNFQMFSKKDPSNSTNGRGGSTGVGVTGSRQEMGVATNLID